MPANNKLPLKRDESGVCRLESASIEIKMPKMVFEVHVEPLAPGGASLGLRRGGEPSPDPAPRRPRADHRIQNKSVNRAVPHDVHEPDESLAVISAHPAEAMFPNLPLPIVVENLVAERLGVQSVHRSIVEIPAPLEPILTHNRTISRKAHPIREDALSD